MKNPRMLKVLAVLILLPTVIAIIRTLAEKRSTPLFTTLVFEMVALVIALFCAAVLWSYAEELLNPPSDNSLEIYVAHDGEVMPVPYQHVYGPQQYGSQQYGPQHYGPQQYGPQQYQQPPSAFQQWWAPQQFYAPPQTQPYYPQPGSPQPQHQPQPQPQPQEQQKPTSPNQ